MSITFVRITAIFSFYIKLLQALILRIYVRSSYLFLSKEHQNLPEVQGASKRISKSIYSGTADAPSFKILQGKNHFNCLQRRSRKEGVFKAKTSKVLRCLGLRHTLKPSRIRGLFIRSNQKGADNHLGLQTAVDFLGHPVIPAQGYCLCEPFI